MCFIKNNPWYFFHVLSRVTYVFLFIFIFSLYSSTHRSIYFLYVIWYFLCILSFILSCLQFIYLFLFLSSTIFFIKHVITLYISRFTYYGLSIKFNLFVDLLFQSSTLIYFVIHIIYFLLMDFYWLMYLFFGAPYFGGKYF